MGHFPLRHYAQWFDEDEMLAFVRDPLTRVCSEFLHRQRRQGLSGTLEEFIEAPNFQNVQSRLLAGAPPDMFIGVTERYREDLERINARFGLALSHKRRNRDWLGGGNRLAGKLDPVTVERFEALNRRDLELYRAVEAARP